MENIKFLKKIVSFALIITLCMASTTVHASSIADENSNISIKNNENHLQISDFESMTNEELNQYIDSVMLSYETASKTSSVTANGVNVPQDSLEGAWLAASIIAKNMGYTCAVKLIECSVYGQSYIENSFVSGTGLFTDKIFTSSEYNNYFGQHVLGKPSTNGSFAFNSGDLFYALHNVNIQSTASLPGTIFATYTINITDTYDFAFDNNYDSIFSTTFNNWGWLSQQLGALKKIPVKITLLDS